METLSTRTLGTAKHADALQALDLSENMARYPKKPLLDLVAVDWVSRQPYCLGGRRTVILCTSSLSTHPIYKTRFSAREITCLKEGEMIERLYKDIQNNQKSQSSVASGATALYDTHHILGTLELETDGHRTPRTVALQQLLPLTTLAVADFIKAWLEVVRYHAYSWNKFNNGLEHGDPSLWNVTYNNKLKCGSLNDCDLSILQSAPRVPGTGRTGTIPFMAIDILNDEYWRGETARVYRHELEAFIWILPFVFLRYQDGKSRHGMLVEEWMTSKYNACYNSKSGFLRGAKLRTMEKLCQADYKDHWPLCHGLLSSWLASLEHKITIQREETPDIHEDFDSVAGLWPLFIEELRAIAAKAWSKTKMGYVEDLIKELKLDSALTL